MYKPERFGTSRPGVVEWNQQPCGDEKTPRGVRASRSV